MFESLFGAEMPLAARFFIAFLVVLALIGLTAWLVRRFGANRLGNASRGRQPRLAVIDAATVDGRRRLVLIRRDNVEHLLMIGGPTDLVVEPNIVRAVSARDVAARPDACRACRRGRGASDTDNRKRLAAAACDRGGVRDTSLPIPCDRGAVARARTRRPAAPGRQPHRPRSRTFDAPEAARRSGTRRRPEAPARAPVASHAAGSAGRSQSRRNGAATRSGVAPRAGAGRPTAGHRSAGCRQARAHRCTARPPQRELRARVEPKFEPKPEPKFDVKPEQSRRATGDAGQEPLRES